MFNVQTSQSPQLMHLQQVFIPLLLALCQLTTIKVILWEGVRHILKAQPMFLCKEIRVIQQLN